ncbi:MAG: hypothetical protein OSB07_09035 [Dehalococcoidia bacterium]|nr:hypothetical protein [Dehalococcoidia bacterium]
MKNLTVTPCALSHISSAIWQGTRIIAPGIAGILIDLINIESVMYIAGSGFIVLAVAAFALTSEHVGSLELAMALMFIMGICNSVYMISIQSSLQIMVPDRMRGRVMGFYGMTWSIMPLGGMQASVLTSIFTAPIAIAVGRNIRV